jgi:NitT/TauT family transport system ATP-binding protein
VAEVASAISVHDLRFAWPGGSGPLFEGLELEVPEGGVLALVGLSGCGKSTLLRLIAGLLVPAGGAVAVRAERRAFVFQSPTLLPWRTVAANVRLPLELAGEEDGGRVAGALAAVGLADAAGALPRALSGGMQMRASLARALVTRPQLMLLDEPFGALDALTRRALHEVFLELWRAEGFTAVLVTHDIDEAVLLADQVAVLGAGQPARLRAALPVPLPRPRRRELLHDPALGAISARVEALL